MKISILSTLISTVFLLFSPLSHAETTRPLALSSSEAPVPAPERPPDYVNLTDLLTVAGPFHTFLGYLESTKVIDTFQNQANDSKRGGITIFVPKDSAFASLKKTSLSNLTQDQLRQLMLFHALPHYYSFSDFKNLSRESPVPTFAGSNDFALNVTDDSGTASIDSGRTKTEVSSSVYSTKPVAVYQVDKVILPEAIFPTEISPTPTPAPAHVAGPVADSDISPSSVNAPSTGTVLSPRTSPSSNSVRIINFAFSCHMIMALSGLLAVLL